MMLGFALKRHKKDKKKIIILMMSYISLSWHQHNYVVDFSFNAKYAFLTLITFNL